jgi:hypothetical protein
MATSSAMPRPKSEKDAQVTIVLSSEWLDEAQKIADAKTEPGLTVTRSDVLRLALRRGLDALHAELPPKSRKR